MPFLYALIHLLLAGGAFVAALLLLYRRARLGPALGLAGLAIIGVGLGLEGRSDFAMRLAGWPDLVFFTNWALTGAALLLAALWNQSREPFARARAAVITPVVLVIALWSYAWYFRPLPPNLTGEADARGFCRQSTPDSCSAAAAVTLLAQYDVEATEAEMARLCLTREGYGSPPLGLFRGLARKAQSANLRPRFRVLDDWRDLGGLGGPSIISVGVARNATAAVKRHLARGGWRPGLRHAVLVLKVMPEREEVRVFDPSVGLEMWPTADLEHLWDGRALILTRD